ncbi:MAG: glutamine synthetase family protein [Candidatus Hodarchaeales archaeon]
MTLLPKDEIVQQMEKMGAKHLILQFTGADGHLKGVEISRSAFAKADQIGVDGSSIGFLRSKRSDMIIDPDPTTVTKVPWYEGTASVFCDLRSTDTRERIAADPRGILKEITGQLMNEYQARYFARPEMEWYFMTSDLKPVDTASYMVLPPRDKGYYLRKLIVDTLDKVNIPYKTFHSEVGPGQHEVEFQALPAVKAADAVQLFKQITKMVTLKSSENWTATFMPKPYIDQAGSGMHIHQMVKSPGKNFFKGMKGELSEFALHFIAGQLDHASEITAICNPIINSYRRLVPGIEAPVYKTWGIANRTALVRVPAYEAGRLEYRAADAASNIYFTLAMLLAAGLDGVRNKTEIPDEADFDADVMSLKELANKGVELLPRSLKEALKVFKASKLCREVLGPDLHDEYYKARMKEWKDFTSEYSFEKKEVTRWEISHYSDC